MALLSLATLSGCGVCRGIYTVRDGLGVLKKFNEYSLNGKCVKETASLSQWEKTTEARSKKKVRCTAQPQFSSRSLISDNNYYSYRDGKVFLNFNSSTGEYLKLTTAESKNGEPVFSRLQGCFYERSGQILLDSIDVASSQYFDPMEIFTYTEDPVSMHMVRFDDSTNWDFKFCPFLNSPWDFCTKLRNGNEMFFPDLSLADQASVLAEALLIRKEFNYRTISSSDFNNTYSAISKTYKEVIAEDYKYAVATIVDIPRFIDQAWAQFIRKERPIMPDVTSSTMPPVCYPSRKQITLSDGGQGTIYGEVCYESGTYTWQGP